MKWLLFAFLFVALSLCVPQNGRGNRGGGRKEVARPNNNKQQNKPAQQNKPKERPQNKPKERPQNKPKPNRPQQNKPAARPRPSTPRKQENRPKPSARPNNPRPSRPNNPRPSNPRPSTPRPSNRPNNPRPNRPSAPRPNRPNNPKPNNPRPSTPRPSNRPNNPRPNRPNVPRPSTRPNNPRPNRPDTPRGDPRPTRPNNPRPNRPNNPRPTISRGPRPTVPRPNRPNNPRPRPTGSRNPGTWRPPATARPRPGGNRPRPNNPRPTKRPDRPFQPRPSRPREGNRPRPAPTVTYHPTFRPINRPRPTGFPGRNNDNKWHGGYKSNGGRGRDGNWRGPKPPNWNQAGWDGDNAWRADNGWRGNNGWRSNDGWKGNDGWRGDNGWKSTDGWKGNRGWRWRKPNTDWAWGRGGGYKNWDSGYQYNDGWYGGGYFGNDWDSGDFFTPGYYDPGYYGGEYWEGGYWGPDYQAPPPPPPDYNPVVIPIPVEIPTPIEVPGPVETVYYPPEYVPDYDDCSCAPVYCPPDGFEGCQCRHESAVQCYNLLLNKCPTLPYIEDCSANFPTFPVLSFPEGYIAPAEAPVGYEADVGVIDPSFPVGIDPTNPDFQPVVDPSLVDPNAIPVDPSYVTPVGLDGITSDIQLPDGTYPADEAAVGAYPGGVVPYPYTDLGDSTEFDPEDYSDLDTLDDTDNSVDELDADDLEDLIDPALGRPVYLDATTDAEDYSNSSDQADEELYQSALEQVAGLPYPELDGEDDDNEAEFPEIDGDSSRHAAVDAGVAADAAIAEVPEPSAVAAPVLTTDATAVAMPTPAMPVMMNATAPWSNSTAATRRFRA